MSGPKQYPAWVFSDDTVQLQRELIAGGYLAPLNGDGKASDDGWFGPATRAALQRRELDLAELPLSPVPWWRTRRMKGLVLAAFGLAGFFVPSLREVDTGYLVDLLWENLDHVEQILTALGALATVAGTIWSAIGAAKAKAPVDPTLVARVAGRDVRLPSRLRVPADDRGGSGSGGSRHRGPFDAGH